MSRRGEAVPRSRGGDGRRRQGAREGGRVCTAAGGRERGVGFGCGGRVQMEKCHAGGFRKNDRIVEFLLLCIEINIR